MINIRKGYNLKIILSMISMVLLFNTRVNSSSISNDLLRVPIGDYEGINEAIGGESDEEVTQVFQEEFIGEFNSVGEVWAKIVDLYGDTLQPGRTYIVILKLEQFLNRPFGEQYDAAPGDVIVQGRANPIDHGGWMPIIPSKDRPHMQLTFLRKAEGKRFNLFIDNFDEGIKVAKIVVVEGEQSFIGRSGMSEEVISVSDVVGRVGKTKNTTEKDL